MSQSDTRVRGRVVRDSICNKVDTGVTSAYYTHCLVIVIPRHKVRGGVRCYRADTGVNMTHAHAHISHVSSSTYRVAKNHRMP